MKSLAMSGRRNIAIYGADGFGREVLQLMRRKYGSDVNIVFVDDNLEKQQLHLDKIPVVGFSHARSENREVCIAVADSRVRRAIYEKVVGAGLHLLHTQAISAITSDNAQIGEGAVLSDNVIVTANCSIGKCFHANIFSYVAHDCIIGDFVTFGPRVSCNGRVSIENGAYIGTNAVLKQGSHYKPLIIGENAVVGMGAVVTKDVPPNCVVVGNPARPLEK